MLRTLSVSFMKPDGTEIVTIKQDKYDEFGQPIDAAAVINAGKRYISERIGYAGNVKVRVK